MHERDVPRLTKKCLVQNEFVIAVAVKAFHLGAIAANSEHARRRVGRKDQPLRFQRMKLRMDYGPLKGDYPPVAAVAPSGHQAVLAAVFDRGGDPFSLPAQRALAELRPLKCCDQLLFEAPGIDAPDRSSPHEDDAFPRRMYSGRERMDRIAIGHLADRAFGKRDLE